MVSEGTGAQASVLRGQNLALRHLAVTERYRAQGAAEAKVPWSAAGRGVTRR